MNSQRTHLRLLFLASILIATAAAFVPAGARQAEPVPFAITHGPYLQLPSATSMTVVWHTNRPAVSRVEYWPDGGAEPPVATAVSASHGLIDNDRTSQVIRLTGLSAGTTYRYRVLSREFQGYEKQHVVKYGPTVSSETFSFTTLEPTSPALARLRDTSPSEAELRRGKPAPVAGYSFTVFSDIHENAKRLETMLAAVDWPRTPFLVFNGDMVNDFMNADQPFTGFVDVAVSRFAHTIPFVYVRGNHDVRGRFARRLTDYFPGTYYSFDHGPVHFIVLDSGEDKVDAHEYYNGLVAFEPYRREQAAWLADDLRSPAARRARYRVIFSHIPPYAGGADSRRSAQKAVGAQATPQEGFAIQQVRECWEKTANAGGVNLWLSGHTHRFAVLAPFDPRNGNLPAKNAPAPPRNHYHLVVGAPDTFTRVDVSRAGLTVTVTRETGETLKTIRIR